MLQLFRNNQFYTIFFVLLYSLLLAFNGWMQPAIDIVAQADATGIIARWFFHAISPLLASVLFFVLFIVQAVMINGIVLEFRLAKRQTYITSISYILCLFIFQYSDTLSPALIANFLMLMALNSLYHAYEQKHSVLEVFNAGFFVGLAALIYLPFLWHFIFVLVAWFSLRSFNIKELVILLAALFIPFFLMGTWQFVGNNLQNWWQSDFVAQFHFPQFSLNLEIPFLISLGILSIILIWALVNIQQLKSKTTIRDQKFINVLYWFLLFSVISLLGQPDFFKGQNMGHYALLALPLGAVLSLNLQALKNNKLAGTIHSLLILTVLIVQYYEYISHSLSRYFLI